MAIYETFVIKSLDEIVEGEEILIQVRDADTYEERVVRAVVHRSPSLLPGADALRVRWQKGQSLPELWAIRILEDRGSVADQPVGKFVTEKH
jgi:hypothetical protein